MKLRLIEVQLAALLSVLIFSPVSAEDVTLPGTWVERDTLTGDWAGSRTWLKEHGITLAGLLP